MTKKDYIACANALRGENTPPNVLSALCRWFHSDNYNFSESTFRGYLAGTCGHCGGELPKTKKTRAPVTA